jgi:hypothetical protein
MAKKPAIEVGDELLLKVDVVRVDEHDTGGFVEVSTNIDLVYTSFGSCRGG